MAQQNAIEVESITRKFGKLVAVDDLSFTVEQGEIFGLLGPNGAGKTTIINLILGLLKAQQGEIHVLGFDINSQTRQVYRRAGYVPQETNLYQDLSAIDNLWHHAALYCQDLSSVKDRMEELLNFTNLWQRRKDPVRTFSGGMKRRLALARALLHDPEVIFFDEPTLGVDVQGRIALWEHIQQQREEGKTFVISTNNMVEADTLCDRLVIIDHGQSIALDTPENLKAGMQYDVVSIHTSPPIVEPETLLSPYPVQNITQFEPDCLRFEMENADTRTAELINTITKEHQLDSILIARPSLDDVFLFHTGRALRE
ncbi:MAG: ABC transporter ATP-binding protein [Chloroflexota bacterium]|nr:MAG: ABC transporter ATP-binding protein [Chloroflexota bacterium]